MGCYRKLPSWQKHFKREWKKLANTPIKMSINPKYWPDKLRWVCTCPYFVTSHFLVCKHLVQPVGPIWTTPFWLHPVLQLEGYQISMNSPMADNNTNQNARDEDSKDENNGLIDTEPGFPVEYQKPLHEHFASTSAQYVTSAKVWNTSCNLKITRCWRHLKGMVPHSCHLLRVA